MAIREFFKEVRQEVSKVVWPTRREVGLTTVVVLIFVSIVAVFFLVVDQVVSAAIQWVLDFGLNIGL